MKTIFRPEPALRVRPGGIFPALPVSCAAAALALWIVSSSLQAQAPSFRGLGIDPFNSSSSSRVIAASADGAVIVGSRSGTPGAFRWTNGTLTPLTGGAATNVSADGQVIVGTGGLKAVKWQGSNSASLLGAGDLPGGEVSGTALFASADGSVIVGLSKSDKGYEPFRWTSATGFKGSACCPAPTRLH